MVSRTEATGVLAAANARWAERDHLAGVSKVPSRELAVVTCMDVRLDPLRSLGLDVGEAHVLRNAGALVTDDVERSLVLSQYALGTTAVVVIAHTDCGVQGHDQEATADLVEATRGTRPGVDLGSFDDPVEHVATAVQQLRDSSLLRHRGAINGAVHDVETGLLEWVT